MHRSFEHAANALLFMERVGLKVDWLLYPRPMDDLAYLLGALEDKAKGLTHYGAATWILDELENRKLARCNAGKREKVAAALGTFIANLTTSKDR